MDSSEGRMRPIALSPRSARASVSDARRRCRPDRRARAATKTRRGGRRLVHRARRLVRGVCAPRESREGRETAVASSRREWTSAPERRGGRHGDPLPRSAVEWAAPFCSSTKNTAADACCSARRGSTACRARVVAERDCYAETLFLRCDQFVPRARRARWRPRARRSSAMFSTRTSARRRAWAPSCLAPTGSSRSSASSWVPSRRARVTFRTRTRISPRCTRRRRGGSSSWRYRGAPAPSSTAGSRTTTRTPSWRAWTGSWRRRRSSRAGARTRAPSPPGDTPATSSTRASSDARKPSRASCSCTTEPRTRPPRARRNPSRRARRRRPRTPARPRGTRRGYPRPWRPRRPPAPADAGALPPPPPPLVFERPPTPSTPAMLLGRLATLRTPTGGGASSSPSSFRTPSTPSAATPRTPSLSARRAEARRASFDVSPALRRVARILVDAPYARRDTRGNAIRAYVTTRATPPRRRRWRRGGLEMASEGRRGAPRRVSATAPTRLGW